MFKMSRSRALYNAFVRWSLTGLVQVPQKSGEGESNITCDRSINRQSGDGFMDKAFSRAYSSNFKKRPVASRKTEEVFIRQGSDLPGGSSAGNQEAEEETCAWCCSRTKPL